eukprot:1810221-Prymnesium_polylepis.1
MASARIRSSASYGPRVASRVRIIARQSSCCSRWIEKLSSRERNVTSSRSAYPHDLARKVKTSKRGASHRDGICGR